MLRNFGLASNVSQSGITTPTFAVTRLLVRGRASVLPHAHARCLAAIAGLAAALTGVSFPVTPVPRRGWKQDVLSEGQGGPPMTQTLANKRLNSASTEGLQGAGLSLPRHFTRPGHGPFESTTW